jgi:hypothetical protein
MRSSVGRVVCSALVANRVVGKWGTNLVMCEYIPDVAEAAEVTARLKDLVERNKRFS